VVRPGDNLWLIARTALVSRTRGDTPTERDVAGYWLTVISANRSTLRSGDPIVAVLRELRFEVLRIGLGGGDAVAKEHPEISFINATGEGMKIGAPFSTQKFEEIALGSAGVQAKWASAMSQANPIELKKEKLALWKESLKRCKKEAEGEIAFDLLLNPLWQIWAPMFERELMNDSQPLPIEEKLKIQKGLFFQQIIDEHVRAL